MTRKGADPLLLPIRSSIADPPPGRAALYIDARTGAAVIAWGEERKGLSCLDDMDPAACIHPVTTTISMYTLLGGVVSDTVTVSGAVAGMLVQVGYAAAPPAEAAGAPFGYVSAADEVTVMVPLSTTVSAVDVPLIITCTSA